MLNIRKRLNQIIVTMLVTITMVATSSFVVFAVTQDKTVPTIKANQESGETLAGSEISFTIQDDSPIQYVYYAWNRRVSGAQPIIQTLDATQTTYQFKTKVPSASGVYEFSIAAMDNQGNISTWINIPYNIVTSLTGVKDTEGPDFLYNMPDEYPYNDSTILPNRPITFSMEDPSGMYYISYKWTREYDRNDYITGATRIYVQNRLL